MPVEISNEEIESIYPRVAKNIAEALARDDVGEIYVVEPNIESPPDKIVQQKRVHWSALGDAVRQSDIVALLVAHDQFSSLDRTTLNDKIVIDTVGVLR